MLHNITRARTDKSGILMFDNTFYLRFKSFRYGEIQDDSKFLSEFSWRMVSKPERIKENCLQNMKV
jgi:hypothetical protein